MKKLTTPLLVGILFIFYSFAVQYTEYGIATYYSDLFEGRQTASGEVFKQNELTAAHKSLPFGTTVKVTRLDNKQSVIVKINDRGAFTKGRIVDLSKAAATKLNMIADGKANVRLEVLDNKNDDMALVAKNKKPQSKATTATKAKPKAPAKKKPNLIKGHSQAEKKVDQASIVTAGNYKDFDLYKIQLMRPAKVGFGVQVALLQNYDNVFKFVADLQADFYKNILLSVEETNQGSQYRVILGPFETKDQAQSYRNSVAKKNKKYKSGFVITLKDLENLN